MKQLFIPSKKNRIFFKAKELVFLQKKHKKLFALKTICYLLFHMKLPAFFTIIIKPSPVFDGIKS